VNRSVVKWDGIRRGGASYPGKPSCTGAAAAGDTIKPNRRGEPEAGQGAKGGRFADTTDDSGPVKPGNRVEDKTLKTGKTRESKNASEGEPVSGEDGTIDPGRSRYVTGVRPGYPNSSLGHGKPRTRGGDDSVEESIQSYRQGTRKPKVGRPSPTGRGHLPARRLEG
jgi:hypothetical protein